MSDEQMSDEEYVATIPDRIPDYGPEFSMHQCPRCDGYEPVHDGFTGTPLCRKCGVAMEFDKDADLHAQVYGFHVESDC